MEERERFIHDLQPMVSWMAWRFSRNRPDHPVLSKQDLEQEAVIALLNVFDANTGKKSHDEMRRMGHKAVYRRLLNKSRLAYIRGGANEVTAWVELDSTVGDSTLSVSEIIGAKGLQDIYFWFMVDELERNLSDFDRQVLTELLAPGERMLKTVKVLWAKQPKNTVRYRWQKETRNTGLANRPGNWWIKHRLVVLAETMQVPKKEVQRSLKRIRKIAARIFLDEPSAEAYQVLEGAGDTTNNNAKEGTSMADGKGVAVDPMVAGLGAGQSPAEAQAAAKRNKAKAATASAKGNSKKGTKPKKEKAARGSKVADVPDELKVRKGETVAREGTTREALQKAAGGGTTVATLIKKFPDMSAVRGKVKKMLDSGMLVKA